jgi:hypothetical protein
MNTALLLGALLLSDAKSVGLQVGDFVSPFEPYHVTGPYAETRMCPVCEWAMLPMVFIWSNGAEPSTLSSVVGTVQKAVQSVPNKKVKAFFVDVNAEGKDAASRDRVATWAKAWNAPDVYAMSRLGSMKASLKDYKIDDLKSWTIQIYTVRNRRVVSTFDPDKAGELARLSEAIASLAAPIRNPEN